MNLEARITKLEGGGGTIPPTQPPVPAPQPWPSYPVPKTPVCDSTTGACYVPIDDGGIQVPLKPVPVDQVVAIQKFLTAEGSFTYPTATGYFGPITREALKSFQTNQGIAASGAVDAPTIAKLKALAPTVAPSLGAAMQQLKPTQ